MEVFYNSNFVTNNEFLNPTETQNFTAHGRIDAVNVEISGIWAV